MNVRLVLWGLCGLIIGKPRRRRGNISHSNIVIATKWPDRIIKLAVCYRLQLNMTELGKVFTPAC